MGIAPVLGTTLDEDLIRFRRIRKPPTIRRFNWFGNDQGVQQRLKLANINAETIRQYLGRHRSVG